MDAEEYWSGYIAENTKFCIHAFPLYAGPVENYSLLDFGSMYFTDDLGF